jgi:hypothetical protein
MSGGDEAAFAFRHGILETSSSQQVFRIRIYARHSFPEETSCERQPPRGKLLKGKHMPSSKQKPSLGNLFETSSSRPYTQRGNMLLDTLFDMPLFA